MPFGSLDLTKTDCGVGRVCPLEGAPRPCGPKVALEEGKLRPSLCVLLLLSLLAVRAVYPVPAPPSVGLVREAEAEAEEPDVADKDL